MDMKGHNFTGGCTPDGLRTKSNLFQTVTCEQQSQYKHNNEEYKKGTQQWNFTIETAIKE